MTLQVMRSDLAALIVHDLKNALGSLEAELLQLTSDPQPAAVHDAHHHCAALRQRFVMFLTLYGTTGPLRAQAADESPLDLLHALAAVTPMGQINNTDTAPPFWYFDRHLVRLALQAALHNASRFARRRITLGARRDGAYLVLSVDDDGPGLGSADPSADSTGLGTALCAAVAQAHTHAGRCGRVTLVDHGDPTGAAEGGARFELWLP